MKILELVGILQMLNNKKKLLFFVLFINLFLSINLPAQTNILGLDDCIGLAIKNNPQIKIAEANYEGSSANVTLTRSVLMPQISLVSSGARSGGTFITGPISREANYNTFGVGFQGSMMLFDFGKSYSKLSSASELSDAAGYDLNNTVQTITLNTTIAYYNYLQSKRINEVNKEIVRQSEEHLKQSKSFYDVGKKPQFDVIKAETDLAGASLNLIKSQNNVKISRLQLENLLGIKLKADSELKDNLDIDEIGMIELNKALESAFVNRPDLLANTMRLEANKSLVTSAWTTHLPSISLTSGLNWRSYDLNQKFNNSWNLGVNFTLPLFQGWGIDAAVQIAKSNLKASEYSNEYLKQQIILDVQQQFLSYEEAHERIDVSRKLVSQAEETLKLAEGRYNSEVGSAIEVTDARVTLLNAQIAYIQALYDSKITLARLKKAMGGK